MQWSAASNWRRPNRRKTRNRHRSDRCAAPKKRAQREKWCARPTGQRIVHGHRIVASHNALLGLVPEATYHDFLNTYLKEVFGRDWWDTELTKSADSRHQLISWSRSSGEYRAQRTTSNVGLHQAPMSAESAHCLRLAYNLHQIRASGVLQESLIKRLKFRFNFRGLATKLMFRGRRQRRLDVVLEPRERVPIRSASLWQPIEPQTGRTLWKPRVGISRRARYPEADETATKPEPQVSRLIRKALEKVPRMIA